MTEKTAHSNQIGPRRKNRDGSGERALRKFNAGFKIEFELFYQNIQGLDHPETSGRFALRTLIRLMFLYFLQRGGFFGEDHHYLRTRLSQTAHKSYYHSFLIPLFENFGLGGVAPSDSRVEIPNLAFARLFDFFDAYCWSLDDVSRDEAGLGPDLLGSIFEQFINNKRLGAYYTKQDVAEYIAKSTILPVLFDRALGDGRAQAQVWRLLRENPDCYLFDALRYGVLDPEGREIDPPAEIRAGLEEIGKRGGWNEPAGAKYSRTAESWREYAARRTRCLQTRAALLNGEITSIQGLITHNLDIRRFADDVLRQSEDPALLLVFYQTIAGRSLETANQPGIKALDPTCGSGAFLIAALQLLQPLYEACLDRMTAFLDDAQLNRESPVEAAFHQILQAAGEQPTRGYFIVRSLIAGNLYGVDIMEEAVEICKLRLYLKLAAELEGNPGKAGARLEPFSEIDFNLRTGNALVGSIGNTAQQQGNQRPFYWSLEFAEIMKNGGFDVVIGNPPYLELRDVEYALEGFETLESGAIHAMCIERALQLLKSDGCASMIVPLGLVSTQRMKRVQELLEENRNVWYANFAWRPAKLFDAVNRALTLFVAGPAAQGKTYSTRYQKWNSEHRDSLIGSIAYVEIPRSRPAYWAPKCGEKIEIDILEKCLSVRTTLGNFIGPTEHKIYYRTTGGLYWKVFTDFAPTFNRNGKKERSTRETWFTAARAEDVCAMIAVLSSNTFWWWYTLTSTLRDLNPTDIHSFPLPDALLGDRRLQMLGKQYLDHVKLNSKMRVRNQKQTGRTETQTFKIQQSKPLIDQIDRLMAGRYGFTDEELDFIINYDIKYRMGRR